MPQVLHQDSMQQLGSYTTPVGSAAVALLACGQPRGLMDAHNSGAVAAVVM